MSLLSGMNNMKPFFVNNNINIFLDLNEVASKRVTVHTLSEQTGYNYANVVYLIFTFAQNGLIKMNRQEGKKYLSFEYTEKGKRLYKLFQELLKLGETDEVEQ